MRKAAIEAVEEIIEKDFKCRMGTKMLWDRWDRATKEEIKTAWATIISKHMDSRRKYNTQKK